jgi:hypothetical protein
MKKLAFLVIAGFYLSAAAATAVEQKEDDSPYFVKQDTTYSKYYNLLVKDRQFLISQNSQDFIIDVGHETNFSYNSVQGIGIFFDKSTGAIINESGGYRKTWNQIAYLGNDLLLFYDAQAGLGEIYKVDQRRGEIFKLKTYINFRRTWERIYSSSPGEVTLVDINGERETYLVAFNGVMTEPEEESEITEEKDKKNNEN